MGFNISNKIRKIEEFDLGKNVIDIVANNQEFLAELLRTQLEQGLDGDGNEVTVRGNSFYSEFTIKNKKSKGVGLGRVTEWITNYMTGDFYSKIKVHSDGKRLWFDSSVAYFDDIISQSGGIIMKLNKNNLELFIKTKLKPDIEKRMKNGV